MINIFRYAVVFVLGALCAWLFERYRIDSYRMDQLKIAAFDDTLYSSEEFPSGGICSITADSLSLAVEKGAGVNKMKFVPGSEMQRDRRAKYHHHPQVFLQIFNPKCGFDPTMVEIYIDNGGYLTASAFLEIRRLSEENEWDSLLTKVSVDKQ